MGTFRLHACDVRPCWRPFEEACDLSGFAVDPWPADALRAREAADIALGIPQANREIAFRMIPLGRGGTPEEAAGAVLFFCSPLSDYVSGQVLEVTGGL